MDSSEVFEVGQRPDRDAFARLVARYQGLVCSVTYSLTGDVGRSEDLAQETFLAAWRGWQGLRDAQKLPAWLCGIARNLARDAFRRTTKDPLHNACELSSPATQVRSDDPFETLSRAERLALVWDALGRVPEDYREPLVLFYREGQSIRAVAQAMDVTEDCARQRLSRGRRLLRRQVAALVAETLEETAPGKEFTSSVMAACPFVALPVTTLLGAKGVSSGTALGTASGAGAKAIAAASAGACGALAGSLAGMLGGFLGMWAGIRGGATLRVRRFHILAGAASYALLWLFLGLEGMCGVLLWTRPEWMYTLGGLGWAIYLPALFLSITYGNRVAERIRMEDTGESAPSDMPLEESWLSLAVLRWSLVASLLLAAVGSAGSVAWFHSLPPARPLWPAALGIVAVSHIIYAVLYRRGVGIARDEDAFRRCPPAWWQIDDTRSSSERTPQAHSRRVWWNDLVGLAGGTLGGMAPFTAAALHAGDYGVVALLQMGCAVAVIIGMLLARTPKGRPWGILVSIGLTGVLCAAAFEFGHYEMLLGKFPEELRPYGALLLLLLYGAIGLASSAAIWLRANPHKRS